ncbi:DNA/RNA nuclease SfsA [Shimia ponticola]|uniref:DNA/RNA nuclease SfsA n=1 Tax=Shimia ponticola TaxID=2582893 RepID=UPI0011BF786B|nr:DNA/RNA nuclease SfsA [Shimia ponticola]
MRFQTPLVPGTLIRRYKRFLAEVELADGAIVTAHCPNPGSMMGLKAPGLKVWLEPNDDPKKKLKYGWRVAEPGGVMVGIDTATPNRIVKEALEARRVTELADYGTVRPEVKYGTNSRVDFLLTEPGLPDAYVEVKNVHLLRRDDWAEFPDSVTTRGAKHLYELSDMVAQGHRAIMLYVVQYMGCGRFTLAEDLDPAYAKAYRAAREAGVEMLAYGCDVSPEEITLAGPMPVIVD